MRDNMKENSIVSKKNEWIIPAAVMFIKALFVLPLFENIYSVIIGNMKVTDILGGAFVAVCTLIFSVLYSLLLTKTVGKAGEIPALFIVFAVADPLVTVTVRNPFHALALVITLVWIIVSIKVKNRIAVAIVSVVSAAVISFIMPCAALTFVVAGILVAVISDSGNMLSKAVTGAASAASASLFVAVLSSGNLRLEPEFMKIINRFGGTESHALSAGRLEYAFSMRDIFAQFSSVFAACLPFVAFAVYVAVKAATDKESSVAARIMTASAVILPFVGSAAASAICFGTGCVTGFMLAPLAVIFALTVSGNKAVVGAVGDVCGFAKKHPAVALAAIVWIGCHTMSFVSPNKVFGFAAYFSS